MLNEKTTIVVHHDSLHQLKNALELIIQDIQYGEDQMIKKHRETNFAYSLNTESNF